MTKKYAFVFLGFILIINIAKAYKEMSRRIMV